MTGGHAHGDAMPSSPRVRRILTWVMVPLVALTVVALLVLWPDRPERLSGERGTFYDATVTAVVEQACPPEQDVVGVVRCGEVTVRLDDGPQAGTEVTTPVPGGPGAPRVAVGDRVVVHAGTGPGEDTPRYAIADHQRGQPLLWLVALFALAIVAFGRWRGVASLAGLAACFTLLLVFVLPGIMSGRPPLLVAVVGAATVMFMIMYLVHGVSVRTTVAVLGTLAALMITGLLGYLGTAFAHLTGFEGTSEDLTLLGLYPELDLRGVLLAGIIIGSLGVLDDVTVSQAATVSELARADPTQSRRRLFRAGARVGRAHVASVVNTLVLAYAGASLPLLLMVLASGVAAGDVLTAQPIAQEIVRSVVATVGLVAAVPITTGLAALVCGSARPHPAGGDSPAPGPLDRPAGRHRGAPDQPGHPPPRRRPPDPPVAPGEALAPDHYRS